MIFILLYTNHCDWQSPYCHTSLPIGRPRLLTPPSLASLVRSPSPDYWKSLRIISWSVTFIPTSDECDGVTCDGPMAMTLSIWDCKVIKVHLSSVSYSSRLMSSQSTRSLTKFVLTSILLIKLFRISRHFLVKRNPYFIHSFTDFLPFSCQDHQLNLQANLSTSYGLWGLSACWTMRRMWACGSPLFWMSTTQV